MRLLAVSHTGLLSGAETVLVRAVSAAAADGWTVEVACPPGPAADQLAATGNRVTPIPELKLPAGPRPFAAAVLARNSAVASRTLRHLSHHTDIVLANGLLALPALRLARPAPPVAWLVHDVIRRRDQLAVLRVAGSVVSLGVAVSEAVARPLAELGLSTAVVRNGTRWPPPVEAAPPAEPPVIGCAALLTPWKGQQVLLEAMSRIDRPGVVLELAGGSFPKDGPYVEALRRRIAQPDLAGRVVMLGHVPDVLERLRGWTVAVIASVDPEAAPLALLEAMSVGVPVIGTDHGGTPEVIGEAGLLVPPGDPGALARAIERLLDDPALRRRCAEAGPRAIAAGLTLEHWAAELLSTLARLALGGAPR